MQISEYILFQNESDFFSNSAYFLGYSMIIGTTSLVQFSGPGFLQEKLSSNLNQMVQDNELDF